MSLALPFLVATSMVAQLFAAGKPATSDSVRARATGVDSAAILRSARNAQRDFERTRRANLPWSTGGGDTCDERIGRFCYWHDDGRDPRPKEPESIAAARTKFVAKLGDAASKLAGDEFIAGQRVRYLIESGRFAGADSAASECRVSEWWCTALAGFAKHAAQDFPAAESAFAAALAAMPEDERCRWTDLTTLLDDALRERYRKLSCSERDTLAHRWWWLADPLYSLPGNDRRTEHFARQVMARLDRQARSTYDIPWGDDMLEIGLRYGWPIAWSRVQEAHLMASGPGYRIRGYEPSPGFRFLPDARIAEDTGTSAFAAWSVVQTRPRERYAPAYASAFVPVQHQIARFRRDDSTLVVAAYRLEKDTLFGDTATRAALVLTREESVSATSQDTIRTRRDGVLTAAARDISMVSLEILSPQRRHAGRTRLRLAPLDGTASPALSDLLLFTHTGPLPASLEDAISRMMRSTRLGAESKVGLYWEEYGVDSLAATTTAVGIRRERGRWIRRVGERLRITSPGTPIQIRWTDAAQPRPMSMSRAVALDVSRLKAGRYIIEIVIEPAGREPIRTEREIEVKR